IWASRHNKTDPRFCVSAGQGPVRCYDDSDLVIETGPPALTCANAHFGSAGYALGTLAVALHWRFRESQVPVFELFSRASWTNAALLSRMITGVSS
ncbi:MAG: hypothetical protein M3P18_15140, partial [Actinomycetota bacterium]|nr:hypothetical protein [Actinomycetota bacterium]